MLREARMEDAPCIARLIMMAMTDECCLFFCGENHSLDDFLRVMTALVARTGTQYSYPNTICAEDVLTGQVCGISTSYDGSLLHVLRRPFWDAARAEWGIDHSSMADETQPGELYLDSLAVLPHYRGRGIAKELLHATKEKAVRMGLPLGLLVDCANAKAETLYTSVGFRHIGNNMWGGHAMHHLQW